MPDEEEECKVESRSQTEVRVRKPRPEMAIYRPGMLRKGTDLTLGAPPPSSKPPEEIRERPTKLPPTENGRYLGRKLDDSRRLSNDSESQHSYRGDSGSTTPDAASISSSHGHRSKTYVRGGGNKKRDNREFRYDNGYNGYNSRNGSQMSSRQGSRDDIREERYNRPNHHKTYDSTQSLYDNRRPGGYLDYRSPRKNDFRREFDNQSVQPSRFDRAPTRGHERASMRAEVGFRRPTGRRRNDSINSTQSERPPAPEAIADARLETQSQASDDQSFSYRQICESFESLGSINWSEEMEADYNEKVRREEEEKTKELQQKLEACANELAEPEASSSTNTNTNTRGILRVNMGDQARGSKQPWKRGGRVHGRGGRTRKDSDRSSSVSGSIAEEDESDDGELASGERTPTRESEYGNKRWSSRGGRQQKRGFGSPVKLYENGRGRYHENYDPNGYDPQRNNTNVSKYKGDHDFDRGEAPPPRFRDRLSFPTRNSNEENYGDRSRRHPPQKLYNPRRQDDLHHHPSVFNSNRSAASCVEPQQSRGSSDQEKDEIGMKGQQMSDFPIYSQISKDQGPRMQEINERITELLPRVAKKEVESAKKVVQYSQDLCDVYYEFITKDINFTFSMNLEQHLWKQGFHKINDVLKAASNSTSPSAKTILGIMLKHIVTGIAFYEKLIQLYENDYEIDIATLLVWPSGFPTDNFRVILPSPLPLHDLSSKQKFALKSCSRHFVSMGDLYRYKSLVEGCEDYSVARSWYLKASLLWPSSGHPYNQLAVVAYVSERVLDEMFYCVRALSAAHVFEAGKVRLFARLAAMRKKVVKYEHMLDAENGRVQGEAELAARLDRPRELWVAVNSVDELPEQSTNLFNNYLEQQPSQLHRRTVSYIIDTAGLLITKIGMEHFSSVSERAFSQLAALVLIPDSPVTSYQLIQMGLLLIYAVHVSAIKNDPGTCSAQQQMAVRTVITFFGALLRPLHDVLDLLPNYLKGQETLPQLVSRVLPAIGIISEWLSCPHASTIYRTMPSVDPLPIQTVKINTWQMLADVTNKLVKLEDTQVLGKAGASETSKSYILPELVFVSSFLNIFPPVPRTIEFTLPSETSETIPIDLHIRLRNLLLGAEYIDGSTLSCFYFDENSAEFRSHSCEEFETESSAASTGDKTLAEGDIQCDRTREELFQLEKNKQTVVIVVRPVNLILDTNAFVDHLDDVRKLVESNRFQIIVPTIVIEELLGLGQRKGMETMSMHEKFVSEEAKRAITWLKEKAKEKCSRMSTLTTQGKKLTICIVSEEIGDYHTGRINDDRILQSCTAFVENSPAAPITDVVLPSFEEPPLYRNVVLLSQDRGICIKATSQNIPTRTVPSFIKWAKIE